MLRYEESRRYNKISAQTYAIRCAFVATVLLFLGAVSLLPRGGSSDSIWTQSAEAQSSTGATTAYAPSLEPPPPDIPVSSAENLTTAAADGRQVFIGFDGLPYNVPTHPTIENVPLWPLPANQYQDAIFSSEGDHYVVTYGRWYGTTLPSITRARFGGADHSAPLVVTFPNRANNISVDVLAVDDTGLIGAVEIYQNHVRTQTTPLYSPGSYNYLRYSLPFDNLTKIIIRVYDTRGLAFDNFSFTVPPPASPTPTPTPSPTPPQAPPAPTLLSVTPGDEEVSIQWSTVATAKTYRVKQLTEGGIPIAGGTSTVQAPSTTELRRNLTPNVKVYFAVSAVNEQLQESANSNILSTTPLHNCGVSTNPFPKPGARTWSDAGWSLESEVSESDGLIIKNVHLNGRPMAVRMSLPYFEVKTNKVAAALRGELTPNNPNSAAPLRTRLAGYDARPIYSAPGHVSAIDVKASYVVDNLSPNSKSCLFINQQYLFKETVPGDGCELSGTLPCSRYYPRVSYSFVGRDDEHLQSITLPQRIHFKVLDNEGRGATGNTVGVFKDCDRVGQNPITGLPACIGFGGGPVFAYKDNPVHWEAGLPILQSGQQARFGWDNYHQSAKPDRIIEPLDETLAGCPDCAHVHWRWGAEAAGLAEQIGRGRFGAGQMLGVLPGSNQDLMAGVVLYKSNEIDPPNFESTKPHPVEPIRRFELPNNTSRDFNQPYDIVFWYIGTGHRDYDEFFNHGGFYYPNLGSGLSRPIGTLPPNSSSQSAQMNSDGPTSVKFGYLYQDGQVSFAETDRATVGPLPAGYVPLNNVAYNISTDAVFSGSTIVTFNAGSISDQAAFANLRILHAEPDPFDPDGAIWVDRTILAPDPLMPDFNSRTIRARVDDLGKFVIASQAAPTNNTADLSLSMTHSPDPVVADNNLVYTIVATNSGPQAATGVGIVNAVSRHVEFVSASSSQGTCKFTDGTLYCKFNTLAPGGSVTVTVTVKPTEGSARFPSTGTTITTQTTVSAAESDPNPGNNTVTDNFTALPSSNARPSVSITSPTMGTIVVGPTNVALTAQASDSDGSVTRVDFYEDETLLGSGTPTANANEFRFDWINVPFGLHVLRAVVIDNGGKTEVSNSVNLLVNGTATVTITSPADKSVFPPGESFAITALASAPSGSITKVEFVADGITIGEGTYNGRNQYSTTWANVTRGNYVLSVIATDNSGTQTISAPVNITVTNPPSVRIARPVEGTIYPLGSHIAIDAETLGSAITKVEFYGDGNLLGTGIPTAGDRFTITWRNVPDGIHSLSAVAVDDLGLRTSATPINVAVSTIINSQPGEFIWFDDALPPGAVTPADQEGWYWVDANPGAFSGTKSHQSRNFGQLEPPNSFHQHYFEGATTTLPVNAGDKLFTYVFLDINHMPREIMLQWKDASGWEHRAYWGANNIAWGVEGTNSRRYMGPLPRAGTWTRLEVPANLVGLEGSSLKGMAFTLDAGRATFDLAGKTTANAPPPPTTPPGDFVWLEDATPAGAVAGNLNIDDTWNWVPSPIYSGHSAHQSINSGTAKKYRQHGFTGAQTHMQINPGDVLFTYVYLGNPDMNQPPNTPDQIMLQWYDGTSWSHRAFWGRNFIGRYLLDMGRLGTESHRYMGGLPDARGWYRLEVPASYVGLEGKTVSGMAFSAYRDGNNPFVTWDRTGKSRDLTTLPIPWSATTSIWKYSNSNYGWAFEEADSAPVNYGLQKTDVFFAFPNLAPGTVPMYRFIRPNSPERFYSRSLSYDGNGWNYAGVAFYVFPDATTPGTVALHLYHDHRTKYALTTDYNEATSFGIDRYDGILAYVYPSAGSLPMPPTYLRWDGAKLVWQDNSLNETGFKIERGSDTWPTVWTPVATYGPNSWYFKIAKYDYGPFRVKAFNAFGESEYSNESCGWCLPMNLPANTTPTMSISAPHNGEVVANSFAISANAFDLDGNGTIGKVEFFANGNYLGEVTEAPYVFLWNNAPPGNHSLTAVATDSAEASTTSSLVNVTVGRASQTITFDAIPDKTYGDAPFALTAQASSGLPVSFTVVSGPATVSGNNVTITGAGTVTIRASQSGDTNYNAAADVDVTFNVAKAPATISLSNLNQTFDGSAKTATATTTPDGLSEISITYDGSATPPTNAGSYAVVASLTSNNYSAPDATGTLTIGKASATISLSNLSYVYDGIAKNAIANTNPAGFSGVTITYNGSSTPPTNAGSYAVLASLANDNYAAADVTATLSISKAAQTIAFDRPATKVYGDSPFLLTATSSSGLPVGFVIASGPASLSGSTLTITASGTVTVRAFQGGDQNYNAAPNVDRAFTVLPPASTSDTFKASTDFSTLQGYRNWYYLDGNGTQMAWDPNGWWQGPETYLRLWSTGDHPGNYNDSVRQWRAPSSGSIRITGTAYDHNAGCGDGVVVSIRRGTQVVWQQTIENGNATGFSYDVTMNVAAGDPINFVVNGRSACWCDGTTFDPTITLTRSVSSTYQAYTDYSNLQGQRNWYYLNGNGNQMTWNGWSWQGPETYVLLEPASDHPGNYIDSVRQWRAPSSGWIRITGTAYDQNSGCGDGVIVSIKHGTQLLWQQTINNGNATGFSYDLTRTVAAGDQINFVTNGRSACWCDSTSFNSTIVLTPPDSTPFSGTPISLPGTIQVEDFDNGAEGFAYHDTTPGNAGGQYRSNTDVDIGGNTSGYNVGWTISGEWTKYTVNVTTTDTYTIEAVVSGVYCCPKMHIEVDGVDVTGPMTVPNTGAWGAWQTISKSGVIIYSGNHTVRLVIDSPEGFLIDSIRLVPAPPP